MKLLLDSCVWGPTKRELSEAGHDVTWAGDWERDPGDEEILARAFAEKRILVTLDKDFGELAIVRRSPHSGIPLERGLGFGAAGHLPSWKDQDSGMAPQGPGQDFGALYAKLDAAIFNRRQRRLRDACLAS